MLFATYWLSSSTPTKQGCYRGYFFFVKNDAFPLYKNANASINIIHYYPLRSHFLKVLMMEKRRETPNAPFCFLECSNERLMNRMREGEKPGDIDTQS